jgi:hypothetical protein
MKFRSLLIPPALSPRGVLYILLQNRPIARISLFHDIFYIVSVQK